MNFAFWTTCLIFITALPVAAAPPVAAPLPRDVPAGHWAAGSVKRVLHQKIMGRDPDSRFRGDQFVTRYELAVALDRFVQYMEAAHKPLHVENVKPLPKISPKASPDARRALNHLVSNGFLPANSPLLIQDVRRPVTAKELADALSAVTIHLSDRSESPRKD